LTDPLLAVTALLSATRSIADLTQRMEGVLPRIEQQLSNLERGVDALVIAPLYEGLERLRFATVVENDRRRDELIGQAQEKLYDAAVREAAPPRGRVYACVLCAVLARNAGEPAEAREWVYRAMHLINQEMSELSAAAWRPAPRDDGWITSFRAGWELADEGYEWHNGFLCLSADRWNWPLVTEVNQEAVALDAFGVDLGMDTSEFPTLLSVRVRGGVIIETFLGRERPRGFR
jgi:hypothetical protein